MTPTKYIAWPGAASAAHCPQQIPSACQALCKSSVIAWRWPVRRLSPLSHSPHKHNDSGLIPRTHGRWEENTCPHKLSSDLPRVDCVTHACTPSILEGWGEWDGHTPSLAERLATDFPLPASPGNAPDIGVHRVPQDYSSCLTSLCS